MYVMYIQQTVDSSIMFGNSAGVTICASVDKALGARRAAAAGHAGDEEGGRAQSPQLGGELFEEKGAAPVMVGEVFQCFFYGSAGQTHIFLGGWRNKVALDLWGWFSSFALNVCENQECNAQWWYSMLLTDEVRLVGRILWLILQGLRVFFATLVPPVFEASAGGSLLCIQSFHQRRPGGRGFCPKSRDWNLCDGVILAVPFFWWYPCVSGLCTCRPATRVW